KYLRSTGSGTREGHHPSGSEARECEDHAGRKGQGTRLWISQGYRASAKRSEVTQLGYGNKRADRQNRTGNSCIYVARTGERPCRRSSLRYFCVRLCAV